MIEIYGRKLKDEYYLFFKSKKRNGGRRRGRVPK